MPGPHDVEIGVLSEKLYDFLIDQGAESDQAVKACIKLAVVMLKESGVDMEVLHDLVDFYDESTEPGPVRDLPS